MTDPLTTEGKDCLTCAYLNPRGQYIDDGRHGKKGQVYDTCGGFPKYRDEGKPPTPTKLCAYKPKDTGGVA